MTERQEMLKVYTFTGNPALHCGPHLGQGLFSQPGLPSVYQHHTRKEKLSNFVYHLLFDIAVNIVRL